MGDRASLGEDNRLFFCCPGCAKAHMIYFGPDASTAWQWNQSLELPTISPSVLVKGRFYDPPITPENYEDYKRNPWEQTPVDRVCHSFVVDGKIQFLSDCTHHLSGQTVDLPEWSGEK